MSPTDALIVQAANAIIGVVSAVGMLIYVGIVGLFGCAALLTLSALSDAIRHKHARVAPAAVLFVLVAVLAVATVIIT